MTPAAAVTLQGLLSLFFMLVGDILKLIDFASFLIWVFYGLSMVALIIMRRTKPDVKRPYRVPIFIPWLVLFIAIFLTVMPIIDNPSLMYLLVLFFILLGCAIYHFYVYNKRKSKFARKFIIFYHIKYYNYLIESFLSYEKTVPLPYKNILCKQ